eukprot:GHVU01135230.1.p1 GENE.GHVU01135230.1~~GHVU01135230.1.p1  ORF type:complete len:127 (+),score=25.59 GHVU01135230.1:30-383(+)
MTTTTTTATRASAVVRVSASKARQAVTMRAQADKQPQWFEEAKVFCNGEEVMTVGGTQAEYVVDIWSGNHPFFQGRSSAIMTDAGQVSRFSSRFGDLGAMSEVETMASPAKKGEEKK